MRRENKLALIVGFSVLLVVAVLVSDHLSKARQDEVVDGLDTLNRIPGGPAFLDAPLSDNGRIGSGAEIGDGSPERVDPAEQFARAGDRSPPKELADQIESARRGEADEWKQDHSPVVIDNGRGARDEASTDDVAQFEPDEGSFLEWLKKQSNVVLGETERLPEDVEPTPQPPEPTGYIARDNKYAIQKNDTLFEVCERLYGDGTKWRDLVAINKGKIREDGTVFPGVVIDLLPGVKILQAPRTGSGAAPERTTESETRTYTVRKGDTLGEIVQREVGSVRHLDRVRALNPWLKKQNDNIRIEQKLILPVIRQSSPRGI